MKKCRWWSYVQQIKGNSTSAYFGVQLPIWSLNDPLCCLAAWTNIYRRKMCEYVSVWKACDQEELFVSYAMICYDCHDFWAIIKEQKPIGHNWFRCSWSSHPSSNCHLVAPSRHCCDHGGQKRPLQIWFLLEEKCYRRSHSRVCTVADEIKKKVDVTWNDSFHLLLCKYCQNRHLCPFS